MRLEDGTRTHMSDTRAPGATGYFGYIQTPGVAHSLTALKSSEKLGDHGFPTIARIDMAAGGTDSGEPPVHTQLDIGIDVTPVAFGPVLLRNDQDGRLSRFPRAMVECKTDDGRTGAGWIEWNQPEGP